MSVIDLNQYRQERETAECEALGMDNTTIELLAIDGDLEDGALLLELARRVAYPPLYCVKASGGLDGLKALGTNLEV